MLLSSLADTDHRSKAKMAVSTYWGPVLKYAMCSGTDGQIQKNLRSAANPTERWWNSGLFVESILLDWIEAYRSKRGSLSIKSVPRSPKSISVV